jgi:nitrilase
MARRNRDVVGHYARPDLFQLQVDRRPLKPVQFADPPGANATTTSSE